MGQICQSCGMPLTQDSQGGGSNANGSKSTEYCSLCYGDGAFISPDMTAAEMQQIGIRALKPKGVPRPIGWLLTRTVPRLGRWRT